MTPERTYADLLAKNEQLRWQLEEATETIHAIRTGQVDALVVKGQDGHELYTLQTADQTYRVFIETMNEGAVTLSDDGLIVYCNSTFAALVGVPLPQAVGVPFYSFVTPDCQATCRTLFMGESTGKGELTLLSHGQDRPVPCLLSVTTLRLNEGTALSVIITDLTAQREAQHLLQARNEDLARSNTALEISNNALNLSNDNLQRFAYVASHDLQEPLRKIQSFGDLLKTTFGAELGETGLDMIDRMSAASNRMSLLIKDLLHYSRMTTQQAPFEAVALNDLVTEVLDDLSVPVSEWNAVIDYADLPTVWGDPAQLRQLFQNLLSNALKFRRPDVPPHIRVSACHVPTSALPHDVLTLLTDAPPDRFFHEITLSDNGIGFDEKYAERIFQVFQRLHGKTHYPGTGVGLAICRKVVQHHRGGLIARSQPGRGATFIAYLPA